MKKFYHYSVVLFFLAFIALASCKNDVTGSGEENNPPVADAGSEQTATAGDTIILNGSGSDPDNDEITYLWAFTYKPPNSTAVLTDSASLKASFVADAAGTYTIRLTVSDGEKDAFDDVVITVEGITGPVELSKDIDTDTHLRDIFEDPLAVDYILTRIIDVDAQLTIDPGVRISVRPNARLDIETNGSIAAAGTEEAPIIFTGDVSTPGYWHGIYILSNNPANELKYVNIAHGGGGNYANVFVRFSGQVKISHCTLGESATYGIEAQKGAQITEFSSVQFVDNQLAPAKIPAHLVGSFDNDLTFTNSQQIEVFSTDVDQAQTWLSQAVPYHFSGITDIKSEITIEEGARFVFADNARIDVEDGGVIKALGSENKMISFKGEVETPGYWHGIYILSNNPANELRYVNIAHGGGGSYANVFIRFSGQLKLTGCTMSESLTYGLEAQNGARLPAFSNNTFLQNQIAPVKIPANLIGSIDGESVYAGSNVKDRIEVTSSDIDQQQTWPATDAPIHMSGISDINSTVTIEAGANFIFADNARLDIEEFGVIKAVGSADRMITFKGEVETPGYWHGIYILSNNPANELSFVEVAHGGGGSYANVFVRFSGQLTLTDSNLHDSSTFGVFVQDKGQITLDNNTYSNNTEGDVRLPE